MKSTAAVLKKNRGSDGERHAMTVVSYCVGQCVSISHTCMLVCHQLPPYSLLSLRFLHPHTLMTSHSLKFSYLKNKLLHLAPRPPDLQV